MGPDAAPATDLVTVRVCGYHDLMPLVDERDGQYMDNDPPRTWFGAFAEGRPVGCCAVQVLDDPAIATFRNDYVSPTWRRRGVYAALFRARVAWCRAHGVRMVTTRCTDDSLPTYYRWGFVTPPDWPRLTPVVASVERLQESSVSEWPYLATEVMRSRQAIAAYFLRDLPIIEVGGGDTPIDGAMPFDPRRGADAAASGAYGLALLGLDLRGMDDAAWARLEAVVRGARRVVLETAADWLPGLAQLERIQAMGLMVAGQMALDFSGNPMPPGGHAPRRQRRLVVLEPTP